MHFPMFVELEAKPCLVVGGGEIAARKAAVLRSFGAEVTVVAPEMNGRDARWVRRGFEDRDVEGQTLVVAATDDAALNRHVSELCKARGIPVNVVDDPKNCTFVFPAIFRKGPIVAAVSSGGASPVAAKLVRDRIGRLVPDEFAAAVADQGARREELKRKYPDPQERKRICEEELAEWKD